MIDDFLWKFRGASFLRSVKMATKELRCNALILRESTSMRRDALDPTSASLKKCFEPIHDSLWNDCRPGTDPAVHERLFGVAPQPQEVKTYRLWKARYRKLVDHVRAVEDYCRAGQERFPAAASKFEYLRLQVVEKLESPPEWATTKYHEQLRGIADALRDISILTIGDVLKALGNSEAESTAASAKGSNRKHEKCTSRFAGRTIRSLAIDSNGTTFTIHRQYVYKITAKQAIEFLDKLIESYEKTNQPVRTDIKLASVFKRGDAMRFRKQYMVAKHGCVRLNIPN